MNEELKSEYKIGDFVKLMKIYSSGSASFDIALIIECDVTDEGICYCKIYNITQNKMNTKYHPSWFSSL